MGQRVTDASPQDRIGQEADWRADHPLHGDGAHLAADDHARLRLPGFARRNRDVPWEARLRASCRDGTDRHEPGPMKRLVADHQCTSRAGLLVPNHRIKRHYHHPPPQWPDAQAGHVSRSASR